jgi:hypothetical protein
MLYRTMGESSEGCSLTTYRSDMRGEGRERSKLGRVTKKGKKFLIGMVTDRNTTPSSGCCFHATLGLFVIFFVKDVAAASRPLQE